MHLLCKPRSARSVPGPSALWERTQPQTRNAPINSVSCRQNKPSLFICLRNSSFWMARKRVPSPPPAPCQATWQLVAPKPVVLSLSYSPLLSPHLSRGTAIATQAQTHKQQRQLCFAARRWSRVETLECCRRPGKRIALAADSPSAIQSATQFESDNNNNNNGEPQVETMAGSRHFS